VPLRHLRFTAALAAAGLLLGGCWLSAEGVSAPSPGSTTTQAPVVDPDVAGALLPFYTQTVVWTDCEDGFECATFEVPMDYERPDGETITLAAKRYPAREQGQRLGSLVVNPGGPGGSGISLVDAVPAYFSADLVAAYDVVGFDPRGVGTSEPAVTCVEPEQLDALRAEVYLDTPADLARYREDMQDFAAACRQNTGELLAYVDTESAARDMDVLRALLGEADLDYLGYSYGTALGATYAELFPERTGRLVLDGGVDPSLPYADYVAGQAAGFEAALRAYAANCLDSGSACPLSGDVDAAVGQVGRFLELLVGSPLPTGTDRPLTRTLAVSAISYAMYEDSFWPVLTEALTAAMRERDGSMLLFLADLSADREADGTYSSNLSAAFPAVTCLDLPVDASPEAMAAEAGRLAELAPTLGFTFSYGEIACDVWPVAPVGEPAPVSAPGAEPILVVGTTGDPATPYAWSEALAGQLESARLLTYEGLGHTAYGRSNRCVTEAVDDFLLEGTLPAEGTVC
jgi:pimeloyl-ACP methyl ester carboxylesterase